LLHFVRKDGGLFCYFILRVYPAILIRIVAQLKQMGVE